MPTAGPGTLSNLRIAVSVLAVTSLMTVVMCALSNSWYVVYDGHEWDGTVEEGSHPFGFDGMEELYRGTDRSGEVEGRGGRNPYGDDWYWTEGGTHPQVARGTGPIVWTGVAFPVPLVVLSLVSLAVSIRGRDRTLGLFTGTLAVMAFAMLVPAVSYFAVEFPAALETDLRWYDPEDMTPSLGPAHWMTLVACGLLLGAAVLSFKGVLDGSGEGAPPPLYAST